MTDRTDQLPAASPPAAALPVTESAVAGPSGEALSGEALSGEALRGLAAAELLAARERTALLTGAVDDFIDQYVNKDRCPADDLLEETG